MGKALLIVVVVMVLAVAGFGLHTVWVAGQFKSLEPHFAGQCRPLDGIVGGEDIVIHAALGRAFIAAWDRRAGAAGRLEAGAIWGYDFKAGAAARNLTAKLPFPFHPHGLGLLADGAGGTLMVVNHRPKGDTIEIFAIAGDTLRHTGTVRGDLLESVNDVVPVAPDRFYATLDHGSQRGFHRTLEDYLRLPLSGVVHYDGNQLRRVAGGIAYANGINVSPDGKKVYVAATTGRRLHVFDREPREGGLTPGREKFLDTGVDNIDVDGAGNLWIAAHPKLLSFVAHAKDPTELAPSQVLKLVPRGDDFEVSEVFLDDGRLLPASSVAARLGRRLLIGPVFAPRILDCTMAQT
ncbi:MAG: SMP-30/gluconolactonase/LRE family protein [Alphaproteobacteria bacterium]|jgi:arylesterase/paraoxonase|nr:hypothetical protein [Rhodospirillaceae bacterium]MDP6407153.1 SMP-30/gluconolactonase/LRE family protein [Alphaproteobacteria bacterium]MDP6624311.1 SMP-30/gluconolactonase/LRE family protein [Alphaproteobacteria bacterium]|tara:strand:- start:735 stop:1784 length:1050 start_codon:yes stop_codon:yes gene_type:complete